jgi:hypothetical protein
VIEESGENVTVRDELGIVKQMPKTRESVPYFLSWPVADHDDFERLAAERLNPESPERFPPDWEVRVERLNHYEGVVGIGSHSIGFFGAPRYQEVTEVARSHGVKAVLVDTDGDCRLLIPLFLEGGVTGVYPFEVQSGMDVNEIRRDFPTLQILGGIDKRALMAGKDAIDVEVEKKVPSMAAQGHYIPMVDHQVPPEVSWENYLHYLSTSCGRDRPHEMKGVDGDMAHRIGVL